MQQLVSYTGLVPPGMYIDKVIKVAKQELLQARHHRHEAESALCHAPRHAPRHAMRHATRLAMQECDYWREAASTRRFKLMLAKYPEFAVPAVVPQLSTEHVLTTDF